MGGVRAEGSGSLALGAGQLAEEGDGAQIVTCCLFPLADGEVTRGTKGQRLAESRRLKPGCKSDWGGSEGGGLRGKGWRGSRGKVAPRKCAKLTAQKPQLTYSLAAGLCSRPIKEVVLCAASARLPRACALAPAPAVEGGWVMRRWLSQG